MIQACGDYVVVRPLKQTSIGSIILPPGYKDRESVEFGIVQSTGPESKLGLKPGDRVAFTPNEGTKLAGTGFLALKPRWVSIKVE